MPSVLVETGFLTNTGDRAFLKSEEGQKTIAKGIFRAVRQYKKDLEKAFASKGGESSKRTDDSSAVQR
jgi:N-acetylmuramoyl-L-alanine amidase